MHVREVAACEAALLLLVVMLLWYRCSCRWARRPPC